jgi:GNAT superfamily N-acetyltransferase
VIVRPATLADVEAMARVHWLSSNTAYGRHDDFERRLRSAYDAFALDYVRSFLAEDDCEVVGLAAVGPDELYALYVHPDRWGTGVGQLLIEQAHEALAGTCEEARLTVLVGNGRARRFYERNGWEFQEQLTEIHFGDEPTDVCRYRKRFSSSRS